MPKKYRRFLIPIAVAMHVGVKEFVYETMGSIKGGTDKVAPRFTPKRVALITRLVTFKIILNTAITYIQKQEVEATKIN